MEERFMSEEKMVESKASRIVFTFQAEMPRCPSCEKSVMLPLQDETKNGDVLIKAWICPGCLCNVMMRLGDLMVYPVRKGME